MALGSFNHFPIIALALHHALHDIVGETVQDIADTYGGTAAVDTGYMASSSYIVTSDQSTYGNISGTPPGDATLLPEVDKPPDDMTAYAAVGASYAVYGEIGTRFMAAQPAFFPAVETERPIFESKLAEIEPKLRISII